MVAATPRATGGSDADVVSLKVAIVGSDDPSRLSLVKALEAAPADWSLRLHDHPPQDADVIVCDRGCELPGALVWDGETDLVAQIAGLSARACRSIVVTSPSGGTGVTSIALHLAAELVARKHTTAFVDADPGLGGRIRLGLDTSIETTMPVPVSGGFRVVGPDAELGGFDRAVIDAPAGSLASLNVVDRWVLVCPPTPSGIRRTTALFAEHPDPTWSVVVNRSGPGGETTRSQIERALGMPALELPCCAALRDAEDEGRLLARGWSRWTRGISRLAAQLDA